FDRALDDGETEPASAWLRGEERVEQAFADLGWDTAALIAHANRDAAAVEGDADGQWVERSRCELDSHDAAVRRRLHGIQYEVENGAVQEILVPIYHQRHALRRLAHDAHGFGAIGVRLGETRRIARDLAEVHGPRPNNADAREVEEFRKEPRQPIGFPHHESGERSLIVTRVRHARELFHRGADRCQRILDLVRQRRAQLRDALQPLRTQPERVDALLIRDVLEDGRRRAIEIAAVAVGVRGGHADRKATRHRRDQSLGACRANLVLHRPLERVRELRHDSLYRGEHRLAYLRGERRAEQLLGRRVDVEEAATGIHGDDAAPDVAQNLGGLQPRGLQLCDENVLPDARALELPAQVGAAQRNDREDGQLQPRRRHQGRAMDEHRVRDVQHVAQRGDEQSSTNRQQQAGSGDDENVERGKLRRAAVRDVYDRGDQQQVEDRLEVQKSRLERL